ncbi:hypothetical protein RCL1_000893 [Eukaryota sp. TZLM3-RCL]
MPSTPAAKPDLCPLGYFSAPVFNTVGERYDPPKQLDSRYKGAQMRTSGPKKGKTNDCTFSAFETMYKNDPYVELNKIERKQELEKSKKRISTVPIRPPSPPKKATGSGLLNPLFGTFSKLEYIPDKPKETKRGEYKNEPKPIYTSPSKKGSGYSFANVTIGKIPEYKADPITADHEQRKKQREEDAKRRVANAPFVSTSHSRDNFDNNVPYKYEPGAFKEDKRNHGTSNLKPFIPSSPPKSGCLGSTFSKFPEYKPLGENQGTPKPRSASTPVFRPSSTPKTTVCRSIAFYNLKK